MNFYLKNLYLDCLTENMPTSRLHEYQKSANICGLNFALYKHCCTSGCRSNSKLTYFEIKNQDLAKTFVLKVHLNIYEKYNSTVRLF